MKSKVKKMQISIMDDVMFVLNVFCRYYVGKGNRSSLLVVPVRDVSTDGVGRTVWGRSVKETVVRIWWGVPSCAYIFFPTAGIVFFDVVVVYGCVNFRCQSFALSGLQSSAH